MIPKNLRGRQGTKLSIIGGCMSWDGSRSRLGLENAKIRFASDPTNIVKGGNYSSKYP